MNLSYMLKERAAQGKPVRIGQIGAGKFGTMHLAQARLTTGMHLVGLADLFPDRARSRMIEVGWPAEQTQAKSLGDALKSGATRGPRPLTRWQDAQSAFPSNSARPRVWSPTRTDAEAGSKPARMKATTAVSSSGRKTNAGMPVPGMPDVMMRARSSSDDARRNRPSFRSMPGTPSPCAP